MRFSIAKILKDEGFLRNYKVYVDEKRKKFIKVYINYAESSRSSITGLERVSKPGRRVYVSADDPKRGEVNLV
jgi:small subunit ribosomal protein S8